MPQLKRFDCYNIWYLPQNVSSCWWLMKLAIVRVISHHYPGGTAVDKSDEYSDQGRRAQDRGSLGETLPCMLMAPGACKIRRLCNVLRVSIQIIPLEVPKWGSHPFRGRSKLWWHVSGSSSGMSPRPSAIAHLRSSSPMLNPTKQKLIEINLC